MLRCLNRSMMVTCLAASASGFLLACAFPMPPVLAGLEGGSAAWLALIPLLLVLLQVRPREGACAGLVAGSVFHLVGLSWLLALRHTWGNLPLTIIAWIGLALYCSLYVAAFGYGVATAAGILREKGLPGRIAILLLAGVLWVGLEYLRSTLFTGFPWNLLGASQYANPVLLQPARWAGVYAISLLIVLFNAALALTVQRVWQEVRGHRKRSRVHVELMLGLLALALSWSMGMRALQRLNREVAADSIAVRIALIQPAIPQVQKWSEAHAHEIETVLAEQSELALLSRPDLVIWPETATPGMLRFDNVSRALAEAVVGDGAALLVGTMDADPDTRAYFNSALLVGTSGRILASYNKRHLVPFGEYVPLTRWVPVLERFAPLGFSCAPGAADQELLVLPMPVGDVRASTLICFEDVFPYLARRDVRNGAQLLVNLTNDGWFDGTAAARQHLALAVVRAVENQVPMVRAANTGVSAFIDRGGRIQEVPGTRTEGSRGWGVRVVSIPPAAKRLTPYTRYGDWLLAIPCALGTVLFCIWGIVKINSNVIRVPAITGCPIITGGSARHYRKDVARGRSRPDRIRGGDKKAGQSGNHVRDGAS